LSSFAVSCFDAFASEGCKMQAGTLRAGMTPSGFKQDDASTS
jgi:hypothetical protein